MSILPIPGIVALVQFALFCLLRKVPRLKCIFNVRDTVPRLKCDLAAKTDLGSSKWNVLAWIPAVLKATDDEIFAQVGLDALCYLRTLRIGLKLSLLGCFIAVWSIPTYYTSPNEEQTDLLVDSGSTVPPSTVEEKAILKVPLSNYNVTDGLDRYSRSNSSIFLRVCCLLPSTNKCCRHQNVHGPYLQR